MNPVVERVGTFEVLDEDCSAAAVREENEQFSLYFNGKSLCEPIWVTRAAR
jgi:hypothetical protein